jgi:hypothetical protein
MFASMKNSLLRNQQLNHVNLFLTPPPPPQQQQRQQERISGSVLLKISHKAITNFFCCRQQRWGQCHFQTVSCPTGAAGKASPPPTDYCCYYCCSWRRFCFTAGTTMQASALVIQKNSL